MKIGIDLDDVVVDYMRGFCNFYNRKKGTSFSIEDFKSNYIWETIGGDLFSAIKLVKEFYNTDLFDEIELIDQAKESIEKLSSEHELCIITSRFKSFKEKTNKFLKEHFNDDLKIFYPGFFNAAKRKARICRENGIGLIVEDNKNYALKCAENRIRVLLFDRPWNQEKYLHKNITRVYNWNEILERIQGIEK